MTEFLDRISKLPPKKLALLALELQTKLQASSRDRSAPIAIVGMGCRFPGGANDPQSFWRLLQTGVDAITEVPANRWDVDALYDPDPESAGKIASRWGGFLEDVDQFDDEFFGIAPREVAGMDPQQRLLLEVAWEALENAGCPPDGLVDSATGVFVGVCNSDYFQKHIASGREGIDTYTATGNAHSVASGRISYLLGLRGPSLSVDTACSSSLVAVHLACQSLRTGECRMALAGGVNLILSPDTTVMLSRARMMAADGRCKAFDADADGFVRSEGCGVVVLKLLSEAMADGDTVWAVIRGTAINQDGRSNGLTAPNGPSQVAVIRQALRDAGVMPYDVSYVETHGTGTSLGDPIEVQALATALGSGREKDKPLAIGSVKTNLGHLESAAGIAGLLKAVLTLQHRVIPPHLHLKKLNPHVTWEEIPVTIPTTAVPWSSSAVRRIAGVSSFGFSGTNAHLVIEEAAEDAPVPPRDERSLHILSLSAKTEKALTELASKHRQYLAKGSSAELADIAYTTNTGRAHFAHRLAMVASDKVEAQAALVAFEKGESSPSLLVGRALSDRQPKIAFLFTGQGSQYRDMGRQLYQTQPTFRKVIDKCDQFLRSYLRQPLISVIYPEPGQPSPLDDTDYTQPALFAIECALVELWRSWGVEPAAVMGHSVGEYAAAYLAGVFNLEDGLRLVAERGRLMQAHRANGGMAAVALNEAQAKLLVASYEGRVSIAAVNGPESVVISGEVPVVQSIVDQLQSEGIKARVLAVSIASHSPLMDPLLEAFEKVAATIEYSAPQTTFISCVTGQEAETEIACPAYWRRHIRETVRYDDAVATLHRLGYDLLVEIGPAPTLLGMARLCLPEGAATYLPSLRQDWDDWRQMLESLGTLYVQGVKVDWAGFDRDYLRHRVPLPTYPFQRQRHWLEPSGPERPPARKIIRDKGSHPLLGQRLRSPALKQVVFESHLGRDWPPYLSHHRIFGMGVLPSPAYLEMALAGAAEVMGAGPWAIEDVTIDEALMLPEIGVRTIQMVLTPEENGNKTSFQVFSQMENGDQWTQHVRGVLHSAPATELTEQPTLRLEELRARCAEEISGSVYYQKVHELGLEFGPDFQGITRLWRRDGEALGQMDLPEGLRAEAGSYRVHPAFLDACFHLLGAPLDRDSEATYLLIGLDRFQIYGPIGARLFNHVVIQPAADGNGETFSGDIQLFDETGQLVAEASGLHLKRAGRDALLRSVRRQRHGDWLYQVEWQPAARRPKSSEISWVEWIASPEEAMERVRPQLDRLCVEHGLADYGELLPLLDKIVIGYVLRALQRLGWETRSQQSASTDALAERLGVVTQHRRLFSRLMAMLAEEGILRAVGDEWEVDEARMEAKVRSEDELLAEGVALSQRFPGHETQIRITLSCGQQLPRVLNGQIDPLQLLFPNGSFALMEALYQDSPFSQVYNTIIREAMVRVLADLPNGRKARVLEVGAGTGSTTASLLPILPTQSVEYVFTDVSPHFIAKAQEKFKDHPFLRYATLDIESDPVTQGFTAHQFDLVVAANVLHATGDLRQTLRHLDQLLVPGGLLVLMEGTGPQRWVDITFGLTEGWWKFRDFDLRPAYPLLSPGQWLNLLGAMGFTDGVAMPQAESNGGLHGQTLILARAPRLPSTVPTGEQKGGWLILADNGGVGEKLSEHLRLLGTPVWLVSPGAHYEAVALDRYRVDPSNIVDYQRLLGEASKTMGQECKGIVHLWSLNSAPPLETSVETLSSDQRLSCGSTLALVQALRQLGSQTLPKLWLVTQNAQPVGTEGVSLAAAQAPLWGMARVIALEHPEFWGGIVDLDPNAALEDSAANLASEILGQEGEDQVAWRGDDRHVARLMPKPGLSANPIQWSSEATYLITGGLGGLGPKVARWMTEQGARHLVLLGRSALPERELWATLPTESEEYRRVAAIRSIESLGAKVTVLAVDAANREEMTAVFARFGRDFPPLRGIVHAAAQLGACPLSKMPFGEMEAMLRPKVLGTWVLHELTREMNLDFFVMFSSTTGLWGSGLLGHYAAASQFLDAFAHYRRALGLPALAIDWGIWDEMRVASDKERSMITGFGLEPMRSDEALEAMGGLLGRPEIAQIAIASVNWHVLKPAYQAKRLRPFLTQVGTAQLATAKMSQDRSSDLLRRLETADEDERRAVLLVHVRGEVARVLRVNPSRPIDERQGLFEMGMDSLMSVELRSRLEASVGRTLPSTLTFNYPTIAALASYLNEMLSKAKSPNPTTTANQTLVGMPSSKGSSVIRSQTREEEQIGGSDDLSEDELAELLARKLDQIR